MYTTKCMCSRALEYDKPSEFCHNNNDLFIAQDGTVKLCRLMGDEIKILDDIKEKNEDGLALKLTKSFERLGRNCPYDNRQ